MEEDVLLLLRLEHRSQARLVDLLERQVNEAERGRAVNLEVVQGIADYFLGYPELCHHPKENALFRKLRERDETAAAAVENILAEHKDLSALTARLADVVKSTAPQDLASESGFTEAANGFIRAMRSHMKSEDETFFPAVERSLTPTDWDEIDFQVFDQSDPLFSTTVEHRFEALRNHIHEANAARQEERE